MSDQNARLTFGWLARSALFVLWSLVAWGSLLLLVSIGHAFDEGLRPALVRLLPSHGASGWGWLNALAVGLAVTVGVAAVALLLWQRLSASTRRPEE